MAVSNLRQKRRSINTTRNKLRYIFAYLMGYSLMAMKQLAILLIFLFSFNANSECVYGDCVNGYGRIIYDDAEYSGKFKNGIRSGQGIYIWSNEGRYEGDWKNGRKHGFGIQEWFNVPVDNGSPFFSKNQTLIICQILSDSFKGFRFPVVSEQPKYHFGDAVGILADAKQA